MAQLLAAVFSYKIIEMTIALDEVAMALRNKMNPVHPGQILSEELQVRGLSIIELALALNVPVNRIESIVHERRNVSPEIAPLLSKFFKTSPEFWLNLQQTWSLKQAEERSSLEK